MPRRAPLAVLCSLTMFATCVSLATASAAAARFRFGSHAMNARPAPAISGASRPAGGLGVSDWTTCGVVTTPATTGLLSFQLAISDGAQGALIGWSDSRATKLSAFASRLNGNGNLVAGWNAGGNAITVSDSSQLLVGAETDNAGGGFFLTTIEDPTFTYSHDLFLQHLTSAGAVAAGYPSGGKSMFTGDVNVAGIRADGAGGLFFGWSKTGTIWVTRIDATGAVTGGWPANGLDTGIPDQVNGEPALDGAGGLYFTWSTATQVMVQRFTLSGISAGWPPAGLLVATPGAEVDPKIVRLSNGDALVAWEDPIAPTHVFAQRINAAGTVDGSWPGGGKAVSTATGPQYSPQLLADGAGGALILWHEQPGFVFGKPYVQRLTSTGGVSAGWPADGVPLLSTEAEYGTSQLLSDGANGAIAAWTDLRNSNDGDIYAQRVLAGGTVDAGWTADGAAVCVAAGDQTFPLLVGDGLGGAIVTWLDYTDQDNPQVHAARLLNDGTVSALASLVDATAEPGMVRLHWYTPDGSVTRATVERAEDRGEFVAVGEVVADGAGHLRFEDPDVRAGSSYRYRLAVPDGATIAYLGQVTVRIPASLAFGIEGFRPNPAEGEVSVAFALASGAPARLELLDVAGRRVLAEEVGSLGPGQHVLRLEKAAALPAGIYVLRLTQSGREVVKRSAIMK